jgi:NADH:ubiquinone oxidoreductase subunit F (NADH-binding)
MSAPAAPRIHAGAVFGRDDTQTFEGWRTALDLSPATGLEWVERSGLQGRGGAGFPTGTKLRLTAEAADGARFVVVNGAEDEPGSGKDQALLDQCPGLVLEGALIACALVGAKEAVFYISEAFPGSATAITAAAATAGVRCTAWAEQADGPEPSTNTGVAVRIAVAPTAYISGEDTAALAVLAGGSPLPTRRPPYPVTEGLLGKPTAVLNVETAATIAVIFREGPEWYRALGTGSSPGTVLCTLGEELNRPGVYEIEFGRPMREVLLDAGGGLCSGEAIRAVLPGGPSSGFLTADELDVPIDHESIRTMGSALGCAVFSVYGQDQCLVEPLAEIMEFFAREQCGQCPPCRMETNMLAKLVGQIRDGGPVVLIDKLPEVVDFANGQGGICSLIAMPRLPIVSAVRKFRSDLEHHALHGTCASGGNDIHGG